MSDKFLTDIEEVAERDGRYKKEAYLFIYEALQYTVEKLGKTGLPNEQRHICGRNLLFGISEFAMDQLGPMARSVFSHWGVAETRDFGEIVFNLVESELMSKTDDDRIEDFIGVYDFAEEFDWKKRRSNFKRLSAEEIDAYLASGEWEGKAGGYAIQGLAEGLISRIQGSHSGVVGLPLYETRALLKSAGFQIV